MDRRVHLYIATSVDGYIAKSNGRLGWLEGEDPHCDSDYGYSNHIKNIDTVIMGMTTYTQIVEELSPNNWPYKDMMTYVFTHKEYFDKENIKFISSHVEEFITTLKAQDGKYIWICGGADIVNQCLKCKLIDEIHLTIIPVILGSGIRLFGNDNPLQLLKLEETMQVNGVINVRYTKR